MESQQIMELLLAMWEDMKADHKEMMARMDAFRANMKYSRKEMMDCQENMEAHLEGKEEPASVDMEPEVAQEVPKEDAAVMPVARTEEAAQGPKASCRAT
jgi:hypothetical protein